MSFQRATWHSGLTYQQTCRKCYTVVRYKDNVLDFRPWYADGFVYCPKCHAPLRHNEAYAIDRPQGPPAASAKAELANFCPKCGKAFEAQDNFCVACGTKR
ncbi:MAG: zinc ribbon domain-containing protein [Clostridia bacterium]|nr:zinc ribbon domain-containing protein [Clostridia bacterium]